MTRDPKKKYRLKHEEGYYKKYRYALYARTK
jgi:hypothetical protein